MAKIITLWQPWASLIALNLKHYETRSWPTNYEGPILIHAAKRPFIHPTSGKVLCHASDQAWLRALEIAYETGLHNDQTKMPFAHQLPLGAVVAIANLDDCREMLSHPASAPIVSRPTIPISQQSELERAVGDWHPGRYAWELSNVQRLVEPIPWRGGQGLRDAQPELQTLVAAAPKVDCLVPF